MGSPPARPMIASDPLEVLLEGACSGTWDGQVAGVSRPRRAQRGCRRRPTARTSTGTAAATALRAKADPVEGSAPPPRDRVLHLVEAHEPGLAKTRRSARCTPPGRRREKAAVSCRVAEEPLRHPVGGTEGEVVIEDLVPPPPDPSAAAAGRPRWCGGRCASWAHPAPVPRRTRNGRRSKISSPVGQHRAPPLRFLPASAG